MKLAVSIACAFLTLLPLAAGAGEPRFALIVGNNEGGRFEKDLRYSEDDARKVRDVLLELGRFDPEAITVLLGKDADAVKKAAAAIARHVAASKSDRSLFIFYYSGHADEGGLSLGRSRLANRELKELLAQSGATVRLGIVDACNSGALTRTKGGTEGPDFTVSLDAGAAQEGEVLITSSRGEEKSLESEDLKGSFFTHFLVSALRGDADLSGDGRVTLGEAYQYTYNRTIISTGTQHPSYEYNLKGTGEVVLTEPGTATSQMVFPAPLEGRYLVYRAAELQVAAEVEKQAGALKRLSLSPGRYVVKKNDGETVLIAKVSLSEGESLKVDESVMRRVPRSDDFTKGAQGPVLGVEGRAGMQLFLSSWSRASIAAPAPLVGLALAINRYPFDKADTRLDLGFAWGDQSLRLSDPRGRGYDMPMSLTEYNVGLSMPFNLRLGQARLFAGPRLSALLIRRGFSQRDEQFFLIYPGIQTGAGYVIMGTVSLRLELNLNYIYLKLDENTQSIGAFEPYLGIGMLL